MDNDKEISRRAGKTTVNYLYTIYGALQTVAWGIAATGTGAGTVISSPTIVIPGVGAIPVSLATATAVSATAAVGSAFYTGV